MRYKIKKTKNPKFGDERIVEKFLILPKRIDDEIRWLEIVKIHQVYTSKTIRIASDLGWDTATIYYWEDVKFIDEEN